MVVYAPPGKEGPDKGKCEMTQRISAFAGLFVFWCIGVTSPLAGQGNSSLSGSVSDSTGAVVVKAKVELLRLDTGSVREIQSNESGAYVFAGVLPGTYRLTVKADGFASKTINGLVLPVATQVTQNVQLELGSVTEVVEVVADSQQINTVDATIGNAIGGQAIIELPSFARNVAGLLALQPGVNVFGNVNGGKSDQANVTLDGVDVNDQMDRSAFTSVLRVTLDSVQEFRTTTTNANADQGRSSGAQVALVTRSGTNDLHGAAYWYHRNTIHAANDWFNNRSGVKRPALLINIPGARVGGAIKKDKLFYFLNWEQRQDRSAANISRVVPSLGIRQGNVRYPIRGGGTGTLTPADIRTIDPRGIGVNTEVLRLFQSYPAPNDDTLGDGLNYVGFRFSAPLALRNNTYIARLDYNLSSKHMIFVRGQLQNDRSISAPQFPGEVPNSANLKNGKGIAIGYNASLLPSLFSTFRYGLTRNSYESSGIQTAPAVTFRGLDPRYGLTLGIARTIPVHQISEDLAWNKGRHDVRFGGVMRWISNRSNNYGRSFHDGIVNPGWMAGVGENLAPANYAGGSLAYTNAMVGVLGLVTQVNARWNYDIDGNVLGVGTPVARNFKNEEYEMYAMDTWKLSRTLTMTGGLRWSLMPPLYEAGGNQISTNIPLGDWFDLRGGLGDKGQPSSAAPLITFLKHNAQGGRPLYPYHKNLVAPRLAIAWSPNKSTGLLAKMLGGPGKSSIRAGWGMYYDIIGQPLARTYDNTAFGFATLLRNPSGQQNANNAPRFTGMYQVPSSLLRPAPRGGFPQTFPSGGAAITNTVDDSLKMPYTMNMNLSVSREFGNDWIIQGSYVGRQSRRSLINRDLAMPLNLTDPKSGQTYFEAATLMTRLVRQGVTVANVPRIPFFENFYSKAATATLSPTQRAYSAFRAYPNDTTTALEDIDNFCDPVCSDLGRFAFYSPQFGALSAWSSVAGGNYHAMQWSLRKRISRGLMADFNYTWSKSQDLASTEENGGSFAGFLMNSWNPSQRRGLSDYDQRHIWNANWLYELPFGKSKKFLADANRGLDAVVGGWQWSGTWTQSTELPVSVGNIFAFPSN